MLYGGLSNWYAGFGYWLLAIYGHRGLRLLNGGRKKWLAEGRPLTTDVLEAAQTQYRAADPNWRHRAMRDDELEAIGRADRVLVDDDALRQARLALLLAVRSVLRRGLALIGVCAPERM